MWKSTSELGYPEKYCVDLREPRHRADAATESVGRPKFDFHTGEFITDLLPQLQLCTDDPDWYYGTNPGNTCEYVGRLVNADGSLKRCDEKNTDGERNALQACPQTCDSCDQALPEDRAIAGPLASGVSGFLSNLADVYEIPVISHASTSPELDNEAIYGNFMRTVPSDEDLAKAYCA